MKPIDIDELRARQEQRLLEPLRAWNEAKMQLENAIALAETRQKEYDRIYEDVRQNLKTLDFVVTLAGAASAEQDRAPVTVRDERPAVPPAALQKAADAPPQTEKLAATEPGSASVKLPGFVHRSSRPLFASFGRTVPAEE